MAERKPRRCPSCGFSGVMRLASKRFERGDRIVVVRSVPVSHCDTCRQRWLDRSVEARVDELVSVMLATPSIASMVEYTDPAPLPIVTVTAVRVLARYVVELTFSDGSARVLDLEPLLWGPVFEPLLADYTLFRQVHVDPELGTIAWPGDVDLAPETLYLRSRLAIPAPE